MAKAARPPKTDGESQLRAVKVSAVKVAAAIGCSRQLVGFWRTGRKLPGQGHRAALEERYKIPVDSWEKLTSGNKSSEPKSRKSPEKNARPRKSLRAALQPTPETTLDEVRDLIIKATSLLEADALSPGQQTKIISDHAKLLALKARLEKDEQMLEANIVENHPAYRRMRMRLLEALRPFPEAAKAAATALSTESV